MIDAHARDIEHHLIPEFGGVIQHPHKHASPEIVQILNIHALCQKSWFGHHGVYPLCQLAVFSNIH